VIIDNDGGGAVSERYVGCREIDRARIEECAKRRKNNVAEATSSEFGKVCNPPGIHCLRKDGCWHYRSTGMPVIWVKHAVRDSAMLLSYQPYNFKSQGLTWVEGVGQANVRGTIHGPRRLAWAFVWLRILKYPIPPKYPAEKRK
jgi:hypothetical protein